MEPDKQKLPETLTVTDLRNDMRRIVETAYYWGRRYLIVRDELPMVVLVGLDDFRKLTGAPGEAMETDGRR